jgi:hypothetical protein
MRRFTRLTNAVSTKVGNHAAARGTLFHVLQLRPNAQTLRVTPASEAGVPTPVCSVEEIVELLI